MRVVIINGRGGSGKDAVCDMTRELIGDKCVSLSTVDVVKELADSEVIVDFNHPLASKDLLFEVDIISVRDVSEQPFTLKV